MVSLARSGAPRLPPRAPPHAPRPSAPPRAPRPASSAPLPSAPPRPPRLPRPAPHSPRPACPYAPRPARRWTRCLAPPRRVSAPRPFATPSPWHPPPPPTRVGLTPRPAGGLLSLGFLTSACCASSLPSLGPRTPRPLPPPALSGPPPPRVRGRSRVPTLSNALESDVPTPASPGSTDPPSSPESTTGGGVARAGLRPLSQHGEWPWNRVKHGKEWTRRGWGRSGRQGGHEGNRSTVALG